MMQLYCGDKLIVRTQSIYVSRNNSRIHLDDCIIYRPGNYKSGFWRDEYGRKWTSAAKFACESGDVLRAYHSIGHITLGFLRDNGFIDNLHK